eukprot:c5851_g1_i1.p2 GENE.c5851_g1_i1~~c5851_g1_i1.p2  ORF type:complete len:141 (+),score=29.24 c5851_g1_i1:242-664(+)
MEMACEDIVEPVPETKLEELRTCVRLLQFDRSPPHASPPHIPPSQSHPEEEEESWQQAFCVSLELILCLGTMWKLGLGLLSTFFLLGILRLLLCSLVWIWVPKITASSKARTTAVIWCFWFGVSGWFLVRERFIKQAKSQ